MSPARRARNAADDAPSTPHPRRAQAGPEDTGVDPVIPPAGQGEMHGTPGTKHGVRPTTRPATGGFRRALGWTILAAFAPGLGLLPTRRRGLGLGVFGLWLIGLAGVAFLVWTNLSSLASVAVRPGMLRIVGIGAVATAVLLSSLIAATHTMTRPARPSTLQRSLGAVWVAVLSFAVSAPLVVGASYARNQASLVNGVFRTDSRSQTRPDTALFKGKPRLNILLLGADSTAIRTEHGDGIRTDTLMVASIDTTTGDTSLFQIPRNMARMPFPEGSPLAAAYPNGFYGGNADDAEYFANAVYQNVPAQHPELFTGTDYPGADALKLGVGASLGLDIDYFMMVNIDGLTKLIDAMGGVKLNVNSRIPVAGDSEGRESTGWIEPGPDKLLNGYYAMWYARSRKGSTDYNRMGRQTCVVKAVIDQADPATMLTRYEAIARASKDMIMTDIPQDVLSPLVALTLRVKDGHVRRVLFVHDKDGFETTDPDFEMMRTRVQKAMEEAKAAPAPKKKTAPATTPPSAAPTSQEATPPAASATPSVQSEDVSDACAYDPAPEQP